MVTKILIVDDTEENLIALEALLARDGLQLLKARSGREALELLLVEEVALALIDVQMPEIDGFELAQLMRGTERTRHIPIVFVTAAPHDQQRTFSGYSVGAVDFLYKPIDPHVLRSKIDIFVQLYQQKRQLAEQLQAQREMLRLNELLTAAISHDLRNPLNAVAGGVQIILHKSADERVRWAAERIQAGVVRMTRMIEQLLDFSAVRLHGGLAIKPVEVDALELTKKVVSEHGMADPAARIILEPHGELRCFWDEGRIGQLLSNLIGNALAHGDRSDCVTIRLNGSAAAEVTLEVMNKGRIPENLLPGIFEPFKSPSLRAAGSSGLGMGLYIVDQIVKTHGGEVTVRSDERIGTCFSIRLPRRVAATAPKAFQQITA